MPQWYTRSSSSPICWYASGLTSSSAAPRVVAKRRRVFSSAKPTIFIGREHTVTVAPGYRLPSSIFSGGVTAGREAAPGLGKRWGGEDEFGTR